MKITKFAHACIILEIQGQTLVIDPGHFTHDFVVPNNVVGIVITHQHPDHQDERLLRTILTASPGAKIYTTDDTNLAVDASSVSVVNPGEALSIGPFSIEFFGGTHARIDQSIPLVHNIGILVNSHFYYPGDSFDAPDCPVHTLALPVAGPWMKISESLDFLRLVKPRYAFPTHDAILSEAGQGIVDRLAGAVAESIGTTYNRLSDTSEIA